ncbi:MAG: hypothetical protein P0Y53_01350 [Candidatus Pseudobacter hemicellulosilyticus]|uniref:Uncharacterized protein n=1 Tax=Candidatus Pseudobacter hemicellulosilyticus TaxID=3121375 RepID=A0AAJ5WV23_9BACT|nr:MAG: hypothetical protein P0Y53_01350 [Pseudobacter sp.]
MKSIKFGFLATIAVIAIAATAATRPEVIEKIAPTDNYTCRQTLDYSNIKFNHAGGTNVTVTTNQTCPGTTTYCAAIDPTSLTPLASSKVCDGSNNFVCCIRVLPTDASCTNPLYPDKVEIFCKPNTAP